MGADRILERFGAYLDGQIEISEKEMIVLEGRISELRSMRATLQMFISQDPKPRSPEKDVS